MQVLSSLKQNKTRLKAINADIANQFLKNVLSDEEADCIISAIQDNINELNNLVDTIEAGKRLNKLQPPKKKTPEYLVKRIQQGIEDAGCVTSEDFEDFRREFRTVIKAELKKIGADNLELLKRTHYYMSGFFTYKGQAYYINLSDVRYSKEDTILIRTAKDYKDYTGGTNNFIKLKTDMFKEYFHV